MEPIQAPHRTEKVKIADARNKRRCDECEFSTTTIGPQRALIYLCCRNPPQLMMVEATVQANPLDPRTVQKMQAIQPMFPQMAPEAWCGEFLPKGTPPRHEVTAAVYEMARTVLKQFDLKVPPQMAMYENRDDDGRQADPRQAG
jgi:hypothetical protein